MADPQNEGETLRFIDASRAMRKEMKKIDKDFRKWLIKAIDDWQESICNSPDRLIQTWEQQADMLAEPILAELRKLALGAKPKKRMGIDFEPIKGDWNDGYNQGIADFEENLKEVFGE